jgi:hypothetical protein
MGSLFQNVCYPTQAQALTSACSVAGSRNSVGADVFTSECVSSDNGAGGFEMCNRVNGGTCASTAQPWPVLPSCDHDGGVSLSYDYFLVALALLCAVWGGKKLIQLFDTHHAES